MSAIAMMLSHLSPEEKISLAIVFVLSILFHAYGQRQDSRREQELRRDLQHLSLHCEMLRQRLEQYGESPDVDIDVARRSLSVHGERDPEEEDKDDESDDEEGVQQGGIATPVSEPAEPQGEEEAADLDAELEADAEAQLQQEPDEDEEENEDNDWDGLSDSHSEVSESDATESPSSSSSELI